MAFAMRSCSARGFGVAPVEAKRAAWAGAALAAKTRSGIVMNWPSAARTRSAAVKEDVE
jgi:hypothetical protein